METEADVALKAEHILLCLSGFHQAASETTAKLLHVLDQFVTLKCAVNEKHKILISYCSGPILHSLVEFREGTAAHNGERWQDLFEEHRAQTPFVERQNLTELIRAAEVLLASSLMPDKTALCRIIVVHRNGETELVAPDGFIECSRRYLIDCIFWSSSTDVRDPQSEFDKLHLLEQHHDWPSLLLDVGDNDERLAEAFAVLVAHPAHRSVQDSVDLLLGTEL